VGTYTLESSNIQPQSEELGIDQARSATKGTAERKLTPWRRRKFSRKVSRVSNKFEVQARGTAERALTSWSDRGVAENYQKMKQSVFEFELSASKRDS
jgi:hypothetical protein